MRAASWIPLIVPVIFITLYYKHIHSIKQCTAPCWPSPAVRNIIHTTPRVYTVTYVRERQGREASQSENRAKPGWTLSRNWIEKFSQVSCQPDSVLNDQKTAELEVLLEFSQNLLLKTVKVFPEYSSQDRCSVDATINLWSAPLVWNHHANLWCAPHKMNCICM